MPSDPLNTRSTRNQKCRRGPESGREGKPRMCEGMEPENTPDTAALVPYTGKDAAATREAVVNARAELARRRLDLQNQQEQARKDLESKRRELEAEFERKRAELEQQMGPLRDQLKKMETVLWAVDLYLGRDETLSLIRDGKPAPADTPVTVRQKVLVMAEESLIMMGERQTGMTSEHIDRFIAWLTEDDERLDRVLPEPKGVVVLIPTRVKARSGNIYEDAARDSENQRSYWLLRNGERLYLLTVDPELRIFDRILPRRREFVEVFDRRLFGFARGKDEPLLPGSDEWFKLEEVADARRRHYMRIMMVLQGIADRTPAWAPLPEGGINFMSVASQDAGIVNLIQDDEDSIQIGEGGETFSAYQRRLNNLLRPGLRIIGNWGVHAFREMYIEGDRWSRGRHPRIHPGNAPYPSANVPHLIEDRRDGGFVIRYERTDQIEKRNVPVEGQPGYVHPWAMVDAKQRASCVVKVDDDWVLPFDLVTVSELERFLYSRQERSEHFLTMVPTVRAALQAKLDEAAEETNFRVLIGQLLVMEGAETDGLDQLVDELVHWWKLKNTWTKPLNGDGEHEKNAATQILAEYRSRQAAAADDATAVLEAGKAIPGVMAIARDRRGQWAAYVPSPGAHDRGVFVDVTRIRKDGTLGKTSPWQTIAQRTASSLHVAWSAEEWGAWKFFAHPRHYLPEPQREALTEEARRRAGGIPIAVTELFDPKTPQERSLHIYVWDTNVAATPEAAPVTATDNPHSWRLNREHRLIRHTGWFIDWPDGKPRLGGDAQRTSAPDYFSGFSAGFGSGDSSMDLPWWPDTAHAYQDVRPRLVWLDESMLTRVKSHRDRCVAELKREREVSDARRRQVLRYVDPIMKAAEAEQLRLAHEEFVADFGADAEDLWEAHLKTLKLRLPFHGSDIQTLISLTVNAGEEPAGKTLTELAERAVARGDKDLRGWLYRPANLGSYGHLVVTEPADDPE